MTEQRKNSNMTMKIGGRELQISTEREKVKQPAGEKRRGKGNKRRRVKTNKEKDNVVEKGCEEQKTGKGVKRKARKRGAQRRAEKTVEKGHKSNGKIRKTNKKQKTETI